MPPSIPLPPRTPTPPSPERTEVESGLGLSFVKSQRFPHPEIRFDLSPPPTAGIQDSIPPEYVQNAQELTPALSVMGSSPNLGRNGSLSPDSARIPPGGVREDGNKIFNFTPLATGGSPIKSNVASRRGHRYKHSSVSHDIFLSPPPRAPLALPASLPIPTAKEYWKSTTREQSARATWCGCHVAVAAYALWSAEGSLAITALSHLLLFDALGAILSVFVDVSGNFEVWKRSSVRHPFGLERIQILAGFVMSVLLLFMGLDLISHNIQHFLENVGTHIPHRMHHHDSESGHGTSSVPSLVAIGTTCISALLLQNHSRIGKIMKIRSNASRLPPWMTNPTHILTLLCASLIMVLPSTADQILSTSIAVSMVFLGTCLVTILASILLMASPKAVLSSNLVGEIAADPSITAVQDARFWTVHQGLGIAAVRLSITPDAEGENRVARVRDRIAGLIKTALGGVAGRGTAIRWEVTTEIEVARGNQ